MWFVVDGWWSEEWSRGSGVSEIEAEVVRVVREERGIVPTLYRVLGVIVMTKMFPSFDCFE